MENLGLTKKDNLQTQQWLHEEANSIAGRARFNAYVGYRGTGTLYINFPLSRSHQWSKSCCLAL